MVAVLEDGVGSARQLQPGELLRMRRKLQHLNGADVIKAARLVIEEGATFVGKSEVTPNKVTQMKPEVVRQPDQQQKAVAVAR